jgi:sulfite dehydrogenase (quinone) subunit SoeC
MRPAFSVIFLTTLIGAGQGLSLALFTVQDYTLVKLLPEAASGFYAQGSLLAAALLAAGLAASFFHLGHPERAWRAAAQWRTSWLSREVIALPAFLGVVLLYGAAQWADFKPVLLRVPPGLAIDATVILGALGTVLAFALFVCTAMIYACLRFLREWHTPLTVANYILLGGASGFTLATGLAARTAPELVGFLAGWAVIITLVAAASRFATLIRNARLQPLSTLQTAIGVKHPRIVQKSSGAMGGSFNTREFFHGQSARTVAWIQWVGLALVFPAPTLLLGLGVASGSWQALAAAFVIQYAGLLAERWLFFAQARHPQNLYYQSAG